MNATGNGNSTLNVSLQVAGCPSFNLNPVNFWVGSPQITATEPLAYFSSGYYNEICYSNNYTVDMNVWGSSGVSWDRIAAYPSNTTWYETGNSLLGHKPECRF